MKTAPIPAPSLQEAFLRRQREIFDREYSTDAADVAESGFSSLIRSFVFRELFNRVANRVPRGARVLDIGCGNGAMLRRLAPTIGRGFGVDLSKAAIRLAEKEANNAVNLQFTHARFEEIALSERFDVILMLDLFEHVTNEQRLLGKCRELLGENGRTVVSTPNRGRLTNMIKEIFLLTPLTGRAIALIPSHFREYTMVEFRRAIEKAGFRIARVEADTLIDLKYFPRFLLKSPLFVRAVWTLGRIFPSLASNYFIDLAPRAWGETA